MLSSYFVTYFEICVAYCPERQLREYDAGRKWYLPLDERRGEAIGSFFEASSSGINARLN
jgi:hypothetical protein